MSFPTTQECCYQDCILGLVLLRLVGVVCFRRGLPYWRGVGGVYRRPIDAGATAPAGFLALHLELLGLALALLGGLQLLVL